MTDIAGAPIHSAALNKKITNVTTGEELKIQRIRVMSTVVLSQMLPDQ